MQPGPQGKSGFVISNDGFWMAMLSARTGAPTQPRARMDSNRKRDVNFKAFSWVRPACELLYAILSTFVTKPIRPNSALPRRIAAGDALGSDVGEEILLPVR